MHVEQVQCGRFQASDFRICALRQPSYMSVHPLAEGRTKKYRVYHGCTAILPCVTVAHVVFHLYHLVKVTTSVFPSMTSENVTKILKGFPIGVI